MIFVDTNVLMWAVGREHPLREESRDLLHLASCHRRKVTRIKTFDRALAAALQGEGRRS